MFSIQPVAEQNTDGKITFVYNKKTKVEYGIENIHAPLLMYKLHWLDIRCLAHCNRGFLDPLMTFRWEIHYGLISYYFGIKSEHTETQNETHNKKYSHGWSDLWNAHHACSEPGCGLNAPLDQRLVSQRRNLIQRVATLTIYLEKNTGELQTAIYLICMNICGGILRTSWWPQGLLMWIKFSNIFNCYF